MKLATLLIALGRQIKPCQVQEGGLMRPASAKVTANDDGRCHATPKK